MSAPAPVASASPKKISSRVREKFGDLLPHCEPHWYQGGHSPYYREKHVVWRQTLRDFVEKELKPNVDDWVESENGYPLEIHQKAYKLGIQGAIFPTEYGGTPPNEYDMFHQVIMWDELARCGGGMVFAHLSVNSMALPPLLNAGSDELKARIVPDIVQGKKFISLALSEPTAGSDIMELRTTAEKKDDYYLVNGSKKWITGGMQADYLTTLVRTGSEEDGIFGLSMLLIPTNLPGVKRRKMDMQFDTSHSTTFIEFEDVKVPASNLIGEEGQAFMFIVSNLNKERLVIAISACRSARMCYSEALKYVLHRKVFGKTLIEHQVIQAKLADMVREIEACQDQIDRIAYQFDCGVPDGKLGNECAMLKVRASRTFEFCAREASQLLGGSSITKSGKGQLVERMSRDVRTTAIAGGSEELLLSQVGKDIYKKSKKALKSKL